VTAGNIGSTKRMDYTVIGDAVNLASRLCANARAGQILVSESTYHLLGNGLPAKKLEPIRVKGKDTPVEVYEIDWRAASSGTVG
jgi:adenylate cyclase